MTTPRRLPPAAPRRAKPAPARARKPAISEKRFQGQLEAALRLAGYWVFSIPDSRKATARGLPDVLALHPTKRVLLALECKAERTKVRPEQTVVLAMLAAVERIDARIVRPADWESIEKELTQ